MTEITQILTAIDRGDAQAADELLPLVYGELRRLAAQKLSHEKPGQTLQATALVHEAYIRLVGSEDQHWDSRGHFFAAAAEAMRRILLNRARDKQRLKRGGGRRVLDLDQIEFAVDMPGEDLIGVDEVIEQLAVEDKVCADLVRLRFYAGLTVEEAAASLNIGRRTADRYWAFARAWLYSHLRPDD